MTNNIFVPQTFNGERMVNVNLPNRRVGTQAMNEGSTTPTATTTPTNTSTSIVPTVTPARLRIAPAVEATSPKNLKPQISPQTASSINNITTTTTTTIVPPPSPINNKNIYKYWSEANIAILIQLHRRYFNNTEQSVETWSQLTKEYNGITGDGRTKQTVMKRWSKVMRKYNAERSCLIQQKSTQQMPLVSYWNHFQYLDSYLSHLPIPEDSLYKEEEDEDFDETMITDKKRKLNPIEPIQEKIKLLETVLEQTMDRQESQMNCIKTHYDNMNQMNMKFVDMCEKITLRNQSNETRYLDLLEKYLTKST